MLNVSGHRLSTMEVESALVSHPWVAEAAVVGKPDDMKGQAIAASRHPGRGPRGQRRPQGRVAQARRQGDRRPGPADDIRFAEALPKTRSGKIMRRLLRDIAAGRESAGDTSTLEDLAVLAKLREDDDA